LPGFDRFWAEYPAGSRKVGKPQCRKKWHGERLEAQADAILAGLAKWKASAHWREGFVCQPHKFLNQRFWESEPAEEDDGMSFEPAKTRDEAIDDFEWMRRSFFPRWRSLGDGEISAWVDALQKVPKSVLDAAVPEHHRERGAYTSPVLKELMAKCREVYRRQRPPAVVTTNPANREKIVDWIRRESTAPMLGDPFTQGGPEGDRGLIERHYSHAWRAVKSDEHATDYGRQFMRGAIYGHCLTALMEVSTPEAEARELAECIVDLGEGQRVVIAKPMLGGMERPKVSTPHEQIMALAKAHDPAQDKTIKVTAERVSIQ
jgi:hypothetical protein